MTVTSWGRKRQSSKIKGGPFLYIPQAGTRHVSKNRFCGMRTFTWRPTAGLVWVIHTSSRWTVTCLSAWTGSIWHTKSNDKKNIIEVFIPSSLLWMLLWHIKSSETNGVCTNFTSSIAERSHCVNKLTGQHFARICRDGKYLGSGRETLHFIILSYI